MKITRIPLLVAALALLMVACTKAEIETVESKSPDGNSTVTVTGSQSMPGDPIIAKIHWEVPNGKEDMEFEFQASQLTSENVKVVWTNNEEGNISLELADGDVWFVEFITNGSEVHTARSMKSDGLVLPH